MTEEDDQLRDYIDDISSLSSNDLADRLSQECQQILSKQNLSSLPRENAQLNYLALITIRSLYNQHLTDDAKQLYNETLIRALKEEYELINNDKTEAIEKYSSFEEKYLKDLNMSEQKYNSLQIKYDELLEQIELERLDSKQSLNDLVEKYELREKQYEFNLYSLHQENETLKYNLLTLQETYQKSNDRTYDQLDAEYQQLRKDYNELINENELLKDYNSQMYQKLQDDGKDTGE